MKYLAQIDIMPHKELLDPQGKAVKSGLANMGIDKIHDVRVGKHISIQVEAMTQVEARETIEIACKKLLANLVIESYDFSISEV